MNTFDRAFKRGYYTKKEEAAIYGWGGKLDITSVNRRLAHQAACRDRWIRNHQEAGQ